MRVVVQAHAVQHGQGVLAAAHAADDDVIDISPLVGAAAGFDIDAGHTGECFAQVEHPFLPELPGIQHGDGDACAVVRNCRAAMG